MRKLPNPSDVEKLLGLFGETDALDAELQGDLRAVLRVALQFQRELQRLGDDPAHSLEADDSLHEDIDMLRDDIRSVIEPFERIEAVSVSLGEVPRVPWPIIEDLSWSGIRARFESRLARLGEPDIALWERYSQVVGLMRIELSFWGRTAGMTAAGYISDAT